MSDRAVTLEKVLEITRELARPLDLNTLLAKVVDAALAILDAERGTVFLYDPAADVLISRVATGSGELRIPANRGFAGECVKTRHIVVVPFFISDGLHAVEDIPVLLGEPERLVKERLAVGQPTWRNPTERDGRLIWYSASVGTEPLLAEVILQRVCEACARP